MNSKEIRNKFFDFFSGKGHEIVPSAPMVVKNDPTLMFTNAGMNQFKEFFLGNAVPKSRRIANSQKCLRVSGKHNDLEEVGHDTYHHTMFEMLGNWSFGDYFKKEAIEWAWELLTKEYAINPERLYATVFEGSPEEKVDRDTEAFKYWNQFLPEDRILDGNKKDNFWEMGDTGPCGPCSEVHIDLRPEEERTRISGATLVNKDHPLVIEIWNLVFIQYNRKSDRSLELLPEKHVDTGMGFERLCMVIQGFTSNYDTDVFRSVIAKIEAVSGLVYRKDGTDTIQDVAMRVISDHIRAIAFAIADGQLPGNTGAGYVIRRILRRAVRYGYQNLNLEEPFLYKILPALSGVLGDAYPELVSQKTLIEKVIQEEETSFYRTLAAGIKKLEDYCVKQTSSSKNKVIEGKVVFELYDTFGFPVDLTSLIAKSYNLSIDEKGFESELQLQKERSRKATTLTTDDWQIISEDPGTVFTGYEENTTSVKITRYRKVSAKGKDFYQLVFDKTPFYAESGGQVGDTGYIEFKGAKTSITDTKKENNLWVHYTNELPENIEAEFMAFVSSKRQSTANNHTATHLLHEALREILGTHVEQKGSLVHPDYLRFDFSHFQKVSDEDLLAVEKLVNKRIRQNWVLEEMRETTMAEAEKMGAMALFGEKYGDKVRVIKFGSSVELCGGIHVEATGQIGFFKITSEGAIAAGIRRIEAITGDKAEAFIYNKLSALSEVEALFKNPKNVVQAVTASIEQNIELSKKLESLGREKMLALKKELIASIKEESGRNIIAKRVDIESAALMKDLAFQLKSEVPNLCMVVGSVINEKPLLTVVVAENLLADAGFDANSVIREISGEIKGGGGGQPFYATAGGKEISGLDKAIAKALEIFS